MMLEFVVACSGDASSPLSWNQG